MFATALWVPPLELGVRDIYTHLEKVLVHMIDEQDSQIFKSHNDYVRNKRKFLQYLQYAETWQSTSVIYSYAAFLCDILLIVIFIAFFLKYCKTIQAMLAAFITTNMSGIPPTKVNPIGRMFPPLFTINLPEEDQIVKDLEDIEGMQTTIQTISFIVCVIILYQIFKRCHYMRSIVKYCFAFILILRILRGSRRTDLFVEVTTLQKAILYGLIIPPQAITPHQLDYPDKSQKKMFASTPVGVALK